MKNKTLLIFLAVLVGLLIFTGIWIFSIYSKATYSPTPNRGVLDTKDVPEITITQISNSQIPDIFTSDVFDSSKAGKYTVDEKIATKVDKLLGKSSYEVHASSENVYVSRVTTKATLDDRGSISFLSLYYFDGDNLCPIFENLVDTYDIGTISIRDFGPSRNAIGKYYADGRGNLYFFNKGLIVLSKAKVVGRISPSDAFSPNGFTAMGLYTKNNKTYIAISRYNSFIGSLKDITSAFLINY